MPKLSIIVTTYNVAPYVGACMENLIKQSLDDIEIIVVDDGSNDETQAIINGFAQADGRIKTIFLGKNTIGGVATAANAGMDAAIGEYIGFADGDDLVDISMFYKLYDAAKKYDADVAICNYYVLDETTGSASPPADTRAWNRISDRLSLDLDVDSRQILLPIIAVPWRKIYRRDLLGNSIRFPVGDYFYEDNPFHWRVILAARRAAIVDERLCWHRVNRVGQTMDAGGARLLRIFDHYDTIKNDLRDQGLEAEYDHVLLAWVMAQMDWVSKRIPADLRPDLFTILRRIIGRHDEETVRKAVRFRGQQYENARLVQAIVAGNEDAFSDVLGGTTERRRMQKVSPQDMSVRNSENRRVPSDCASARESKLAWLSRTLLRICWLTPRR